MGCQSVKSCNYSLPNHKKINKTKIKKLNTPKAVKKRKRTYTHSKYI